MNVRLKIALITALLLFVTAVVGVITEGARLYQTFLTLTSGTVITPNVPSPTFATPGTQNANLVRNDSFESDFSEGWNREGNQTFSFSLGHIGGRALCSTQVGRDPNLWAIVSQPIQPIELGATYMFTAWLNTQNAAQFHLRFDWFDDKLGAMPTEQADTAFDGDSKGWIRVGGSRVAPPNARSVTIKILHGLLANGTAVTGSTVCIDDVVFARTR